MLLLLKSNHHIKEFPACDPNSNDTYIMKQWILGKANVPSLAAAMAADVDQDMVVTTGDIIKIQNVILGLMTKSVAYNNTPWRYSTETWYQSENTSPYQLGYPTPVISYFVTPFQSLINRNFRASIAGDPDDSCVACGPDMFQGEGIEVRSSEYTLERFPQNVSSDSFFITVAFAKIPDVANLTYHLPDYATIVTQDQDQHEDEAILTGSHYDT